MGLRSIPVTRGRRLYYLFRRYTWILIIRLRDTLIRTSHIFSPFHTGPPGEASFEAELLARTRHCQLFLFDYTASALPRGLSTGATLRVGLDSFYGPLDATNHDEALDYWDSRHIWQRAHFQPYRIAGSDAHGMGDKPKTYTLESLMRQNGVSRFYVVHIRFFVRLSLLI